MPLGVHARMEEITCYRSLVAAYIEYLCWLCTEEQAGGVVSADALWALYERWVVACEYPTEVAHDLGLPESPDW